METSVAIAMFKIIDGYLHWDECGLSSYDEYADLKTKIVNNETLSSDEKQKAYSIVQKLRYYFNANVDDPRYSAGFKRDAQEFDLYYRLFISEFYTKDLSEPKNEYGACYIATAVYGSYDAPQVLILRRFRDKYLQIRGWGRKFISFYYKYSPAYANKLKASLVINRSIRTILDILVLILKRECEEKSVKLAFYDKINNHRRLFYGKKTRTLERG